MFIQEIKIVETKLKAIRKIYKPHYEVVAQDSRGSTIGQSILRNLGETIFKEWVSLPRILSGKFHHIRSRDGVLLVGVYGPHLQ